MARKGQPGRALGDAVGAALFGGPVRGWRWSR